VIVPELVDTLNHINVLMRYTLPRLSTLMRLGMSTSWASVTCGARAR
jgi:hypothetical protein